MPRISPPRFLALGDSYTIGEGVSAHESWPAQLVSELRRRGIAMADPDIIAKTGWTTDELESAIDERRPVGPYDLVTLMIGVNDQYRGRDAGAFEAAFARLLDRAVGFARGDARRVIVPSIPDWGMTPFAADRDRRAIARAIDEFNSRSVRLAHARGAFYADVTSDSRSMTDGDLAADGLHPSVVMYARWAAILVPLAMTVLRADRPRDVSAG